MEVSRSRSDDSRAAQNDLSAWNARPVEERDLLAVRREDDSRVVRLRLFEIVHRGAVGSHLGSRHFRPVAIRRSLALVLLIAGAKLILTR